MPGIDPPPASTYNKEAPAAGQTIVVKEGEEPPTAPEGFCWREGDYDRQWVLTGLELISAEKKELQEQLRELQTQLEEKEKQEKDKGDATLTEKPSSRPSARIAAAQSFKTEVESRFKSKGMNFAMILSETMRSAQLPGASMTTDRTPRSFARSNTNLFPS